MIKSSLARRLRRRSRWPGRCLPAPFRCRPRASGNIRRLRSTRTLSTSRPEAPCGACQAPTTRWRPTCTGSAPFSTTAAPSAVSLPRPLAPEPPPMLAAVESTEFSQLYALLDITTTLDPLFDIAYRFGSVFLAEAYPAGAGRLDLAVKLLEKGLRARPDKWEYMEDIGFVYYWYAHDYRQAAEWFQKASEVPGAPGVAEAARGDDAGAGRRPSIVAGDVGGGFGNPRTSTGCEDRRSAISSSCARSTRSTPFNRDSTPLRSVRGGPAADWATVVRAAGISAAFRPIRAGTPYELTPDGRVRLSRSSACFRCPSNRKRSSRRRRPAAMTDAFALTVCRALRRRHRQLPERLHPSPAARHVDCVAGFRVSRVRPRPVVVREHSDRQLRCSCAAAAAPAARRSRRSIRSSKR